MSFHRLMEHVRGEILLINLHQMLVQRHADPGGYDLKKLDAGLKLFHRQVAGLRVGYTADELKDAIADPVFDAPYDYQFASEESPDHTILLAGVRPFADVQAALKRSLRRRWPSKVEGQIRNAIAAKPSPKAVREAAEALNYVSDHLGILTIGAKTQIFWATRREDVSEVEQRATLAGETLAHALRDYLGLVQYAPFVDRTPMHLFLFEGVTSIGDITDSNKVSRPTTLDGFDNQRFRQYRPGGGLSGCGMTVDLTDGVYENGGPECVVTELSMKHFQCRYLGPVKRGADGTDSAFRDFISRRPGPKVLGPSDYAKMADELNGYVA